MDNLTPITREEMLMNDEPLTPITREEKILAGEDLNPVTRREYFLKKYRHAGGDVMVEGLEVTANGTYTAPEGKAYSPVEVAVPLPDNAYLLKEASGSLVSFSDGADLPMPSFICNIDAQQDLHGQDAPWVGGAGKNKCPFFISATKNGIEYTVNDDGEVIFSGIPTGPSEIFQEYELSAGTYIVTGAPSGSTVGEKDIYVQLNGVSIGRSYDGTTMSQFTLTQNSTIKMCLRVATLASTEQTSGVFKPMIRLATETDPSFAPYSNICPISGHTGVDAWVRGKNQLPMTVDGIKAANTAGTWSDNTYALNGLTFTILTDSDENVNGIKVNGTASSTAALYLLSKAANNYIGQLINCNGLIGILASVAIQYFSGNTFQKSYMLYNSTTNYEIEDVGNNINIYVRIESGYTANNITLKPMIRLATETDTTYEPYNPNGQTIQVSWQTEAGEVFGGYIDLVSGELTVTDGYIASYNGETLPSTWISDRDVYTEGTSPTTGAEVVYKLANPQTYQLTPTQIKSLLGNNNAWCDTGKIDINYFAKEV